MSSEQGYRYSFVMGESPHRATVILPDERVAYTGLSWEQYKAGKPGKMYHLPMAWESLLSHLLEYDYRVYISKPAELISADEYHEALNCLPPCKWSRADGLETFHLSERIVGHLVYWYARAGDQHLCFTDYDSISPERILERCKPLLTATS